ncbi:MAG: histidine phosphatase family protein [Ilumatobacteraceae bacterium]
MRRLVLVRHAKSSWDDETLDDHDRPLAPRGERALEKMRTHVADLELSRLLVLCSTAVRAEATLDGIRPSLPDDATIEHDRGVYDDDASTLLDRIRAEGADHDTVMVVGHNPTLHDLACCLVGEGDDDERARLAHKLPTGAVVSLSFDGDWTELTHAAATLDRLFTPRQKGSGTFWHSTP